MFLVVWSCAPQKEIEIKLPEYERQLVVECFMEVGKPFRLLLTESVGFYEGADTPIVLGAQVIISHGNVHDTLVPGLYLEPEGTKIFNFQSTNVVPEDYATEYSLQVTHPDGRVATGRATVTAKSNMGALLLSYNADSMASITMNWPDDGSQKDYYLVSLHKGTIFHGDPDLDSPLVFDFTLDDRIGNGENFTIATLFDYRHGDTLISTLYHIDYAYWRYLNSLDDAASSNGNPFAQPGVIHSNITGGLGILTGFNYDRDTIIVP